MFRQDEGAQEEEPELQSLEHFLSKFAGYVTQLHKYCSCIWSFGAHGSLDKAKQN